MKAIVLHQPHATLVACGVKTWETRPAPPNGPMRPDGVRGLPGLAIESGERIAIVAAVKAPGHLVDIGSFRTEREGGGWKLAPRVGGYSLEGIAPAVPLPLGRVVCTARVTEALHIGGPFAPGRGARIETDGRNVQRVWPGHAGFLHRTDLSDQLPYGDWRPGRWAWRLDNVEPCEPFPVTGRQGVFRLPDAVAERMGRAS